MEKLQIREEDFHESFVRSSGPGGQKVNKTSSCVYLVHLPTGLKVKCQKDRSQAVNRFLARRLLVERIEKAQTGIEDNEERDKIRRNKDRRARRGKKKMELKGGATLSASNH